MFPSPSKTLSFSIHFQLLAAHSPLTLWSPHPSFCRKKSHLMRPNWVLWWSTLCLLLMLGESRQLSCDFNQLCLCQNYTSQYIDVTCINVPVVSVPRLTQYQHLYRIRLIGVPELTQLQRESFEHLITLASLTVSKSGLSYVNASTFADTSIAHTLSTVDLSYGQLVEVPVKALAPLRHLQWLSLKGNQIELIRSKDLTALNNVRTLLLDENLISIVEDRTFTQLSSLELIDFDGNMIERVEGNPFPPSLKSLSISNCLLRKIPFASLTNLANLQVLQLRGNLISHLSPFKLAARQMELIDLSHNLISNLPNDLFASLNQTLGLPLHEWAHSTSNESDTGYTLHSDGAIEIRKFQLDFNFIHSIPPELFRAILIEKLTLSSNRISSALISPDAFRGPLERGLKVLDLNYNLIDKYPAALKELQALRQLYLKNNRIRRIESDAFLKCARTLEALDLSQNLLEQVPREAFSPLKQIVKVNLHDNLISSISRQDLQDWCTSLKSLTLSKNNLVQIEKDSFRQCNALSELKLGGNKLLQLNSHTIQSTHFTQLRSLDLSSLSNVAHWLQNIARDGPVAALSQVKWLQFDFNALSSLPRELAQLFPSLMYLDLQNNRIEGISNELKLFPNLTTVILSQNNLTSIEGRAFGELSKLESIAVYFNRLEVVRSRAFDGLSKLHSLILSKNQISRLESDAFYNLSSESPSLTLMLDENRLPCLSANSFRHIETRNASAAREFSFYLNVSHNQIETFANCSHPNEGSEDSGANQQMQTLPIRVLDLSYNRIAQFTDHFLRTFCGQALSLFANNNLLRSLPIDGLSLCPHLQTLSLNYNHIGRAEGILIAINSTEAADQTAALQIQTLSLRYNVIRDLTSFEQLFVRLRHLKWLDLTANQIEQIPLNFFRHTVLVKLVLAHNRLSLLEVEDKCFGLEHSLKYLDVSHNSLNSLPTRILSCSSLLELQASHNQIHSLSYITPLARTLSKLQRLDLFDNPLEGSSFVFISNHSQLWWLNLNNLNIAQLDELNVPYLQRLELSGNSISSINSKVLSRSRNIRHLNLALNQLHEVPKHLWKYVTRLRHLDLRENPIELLDSSSFAGLKYLKYLDIRGLKLQYIDSRIFLYQSQLSSLKISTYPNIRSFRLQDILSKSDALKTVEIEVKESILSHQIQWAFGGKLRELIITGQNLVQILPDAFQGLNNANDLTLRITNTSIKHLPDGLLKYLADIRYITIDLRSNQLETVSPAVFFNRFTKENEIKSWQSRQLLGGIILEDNPLVCDCNLLWISKWMKQIFTEMKGINIEAAIHVKSSLALSRCQLRSSKAAQHNRQSDSDKGSSMLRAEQIPITHLTEEHIEGVCREVNSASPKSHTSHGCLVLVTIFAIIQIDFYCLLYR